MNQLHEGRLSIAQRITIGNCFAISSNILWMLSVPLGAWSLPDTIFIGGIICSAVAAWCLGFVVSGRWWR